MEGRCEVVNDSADESDASSIADMHHGSEGGAHLQQLLLLRWQQGPIFLRLLHRRRRLIERIVRRMHRRRIEAPVLAAAHSSAREWVQHNLKNASKMERLQEGQVVTVAREFGTVKASVVWSNDTHVEILSNEDGCVAIVPRAFVQRPQVRCAATATFAVGDIVQVDARTSPGVNKQGGVGRIAKFNSDGTYGVRYHVTGGSERCVEEVYIHHWEGEGKRRKALGRCRVFGCASLIVDCGHIQPIDQLVTKLQSRGNGALHEQRRARAALDHQEGRSPEVCSLQSLGNAAVPSNGELPPTAKSRARSKPTQPRRRYRHGKEDAWSVAQPSMETALDMADVFDDDADTEGDDLHRTPHHVVRVSTPQATVRHVTVHHIDLSLLPEDDSRLYKFIKRLDEDRLLAHMEAAFKVLQDGTRELESLKSDASTAFRRRATSKLSFLEDRFLSLTKRVEQEGWNVFNKCLVACRKRKNLPKRVVLMRRHLNSGFEQAFLKFKDNRAATNHVLKLFHEHCSRDTGDEGHDHDSELEYVRTAVRRIGNTSNGTKKRSRQQGKHANAAVRSSRDWQRTVPEIGRQKRQRRIVEEDEISDDELAWEDASEAVIDLTTGEDNATQGELTASSNEEGGSKCPPRCYVLLHTVVNTSAQALNLITSPVIDSIIGVELVGKCPAQENLNVALCSIHTLCRALAHQDCVVRTNVAHHLGVLRSCFEHFDTAKNFEALQSCLQIIDSSLHIPHQNHALLNESQRQILDGLRNLELWILFRHRGAENLALRTMCRAIEERLVEEFVRALQSEDVIDAVLTALESEVPIPTSFSQWVQFIRLYCSSDAGPQLVAAKLLAPTVGEHTGQSKPLQTLWHCLNVLAVFAAASYMESQLPTPSTFAKKPNRYDSCWKMLESIVAQLCDAQSVQLLWDTSVALDAFAASWGNAADAAKLQWRLAVRIVQLQRLAKVPLLDQSRRDEEILVEIAQLHMTDVTARRQLLTRLATHCLSSETRPAASALLVEARFTQGSPRESAWHRDTLETNPSSRLEDSWKLLFDQAVSDVHRRRLAASLTRMLSTQPVQTSIEQLMFLSAAAALFRILSPEFHDGVAKLVVKFLDFTASVNSVHQMLAVLALCISPRAVHSNVHQLFTTVARQLQLVDLRQDAMASHDVYAVLIWLQLGLGLAFTSGSVPEAVLAEMVAKCNILLDHRYALDLRIVNSAVSVLEDLSGHRMLTIEPVGSCDLFDFIWHRCGKNALAALSSCLQDLSSFAGVRNKHSSDLAMAVVDVCAQLFMLSYNPDQPSGKFMTCYNDLWLRLRPVAGVQLSQTNIVPYIALGCRFWSVLLDSPSTAPFAAAHMADVLCAWIQACFVLEVHVVQNGAPNEHVGRWSTLAGSLTNFLRTSSELLRGSAFESLATHYAQNMDDSADHFTVAPGLDEKARSVTARIGWLARVCASLQQHWLENNTQHAKVQQARQIIAQVLQGCERTIVWVKGHAFTDSASRQSVEDLFVTFSSSLLASSLLRPVHHLLKPLVDQCVVQPLEALISLEQAQLQRQLKKQSHIVCCFPFLVNVLRQIPLPQRFDTSITAGKPSQWDLWARPLIQYGAVCIGTEHEQLAMGSIATALAFDLPSSLTITRQLLTSCEFPSRHTQLAALMMQHSGCLIEDPQAVHLSLLRFHILKQLLLPQSLLAGGHTMDAAQQFAACLVSHICLAHVRHAPRQDSVFVVFSAEEMPLVMLYALRRIVDVAESRPHSNVQLYEEVDAVVQSALLPPTAQLPISNPLVELCGSWLAVLKILFTPRFTAADDIRHMLLQKTAHFQAKAASIVGSNLRLDILPATAVQTILSLCGESDGRSVSAGCSGSKARLEQAILEAEKRYLVVNISS